MSIMGASDHMQLAAMGQDKRLSHGIIIAAENNKHVVLLLYLR